MRRTTDASCKQGPTEKAGPVGIKSLAALGAALLISIASVSCGGGGGEDVADASHESDLSSPLQEADYYLPVYTNGAEFATDGLPNDRVATAKEELDLWRMIESQQPEDHAVGQRDLEESYAAMQEELDMSDEEFAEWRQEIEAAILEATGMEAPSDPSFMVASFYSEQATVCGDAASVILFAAAASGDQPALQQYDEAVAIDSTDLPDNVAAAWQVESGFLTMHAWQPADSPEVLVLASPGANCDLRDIVSQVSIERVD